jgi:hypothetical protein
MIKLPSGKRIYTAHELARHSKTDAERIAEIEAQGSAALADANEAAERGAKKTADRLYERAQRLLDKANKLRGWN